MQAAGHDEAKRIRGCKVRAGRAGERAGKRDKHVDRQRTQRRRAQAVKRAVAHSLLEKLLSLAEGAGSDFDCAGKD